MSDFLETPSRQARVVEEVEHRPWPLPDAPWSNAQTWHEIAFLHWRVDEAALRPLVPDGLEIDMHDGSAWLGVVPFRLGGLRLRGVPPVPLLSSFPELNVRTCVTRAGRPGVWFFSLDAGSRFAVEAARRLYRLPYRLARMSVERRGGWVHYDSARPGAVFSGRYRGVGETFHARPGSLEHFLTERYCLYTAGGGELYRADIHHAPWPLQPGEAGIELNTMAPAGVELPDEEPLVHFAPRIDVVVWGLERLTA
jgi:uncharacterized protein YqjF (DUF2071 family)